MKTNFDSDGSDKTTFAPFILTDCRDSEWKDVRLCFGDWDWLHEHCEGDEIDGYYLNGYGVEGLVLATRKLNGLDPDAVDPNSEGDTCYIHFKDLDDAVQTAELSAAMIKDHDLLRKTIAAAREFGFED